MSVQPFLIGEGWIEVRDGDPSLITMHRRHYSYQPPAEGRTKKALAIGPGARLVLVSSDGLAVCGWRKEEFRQDGQSGVECCIYRREGGDVASEALLDAMAIDWARWPAERLFTFVDPLPVRPTMRASRPTWGHCFYQAGWRFAGLTKKRLHILECRPEWARRAA